MSHSISNRQPTIETTKLVQLLAYSANEAYYPQNYTAPTGYEFYKEIPLTAEYQTVKFNNEQVVMIFKGSKPETENHTIISFRGTDSPFDALTDGIFEKTAWQERHDASIDTSGVEVHEGFYIFYKGLKTALAGVLQDLSPGSLYVTGHSLGSAIATLFQFDLMLGGFDIPKDKFTYQHINFACPRVGNLKFAQIFRAHDNNSTLRIVNAEDIVPCVPLSSLGFVHAADYWLFSFTAVGDDLLFKPTYSIKGRHSMINYYQLLYLMLKPGGISQYPAHGHTWSNSSSDRVPAPSGEVAESLTYAGYDPGQKECSSLLIKLINAIIKMIKWWLGEDISTGTEAAIAFSHSEKWQAIYNLEVK